MLRRVLTSAALAAAIVAAAATPSHAAVTIGSNLQATPNISPNIVGLQTSVQKTLLAGHQATGGLTAPASGVIVRFRYKSAAASALPATFRVIHTVNLADFMETAVGAGTGPTFTPAMGINEVAARMPIQAGDRIGVDCCTGAAHSFFFEGPDPPDPLAVGKYLGWSAPVLADGGTPRNSNNFDDSLEVLINADIEPDADGDGYGDESQDACPANPQRQAVPCSDSTTPVTPGGPSKPKCKKAKKKKKKCKKKRRRS